MNGYHIPQGPAMLQDSLWGSAVDSILAVGIEPYIRGMMVQPDLAADGYFSDAMRNLQLSPPDIFDLAAVGTQRFTS
ncbi:hypothetical protein HK098_004520 [Nowakowskiella sp. JEL0407]|nr:hypothetical protein HK098_004520 [Nowakowskiella sp. JEL0407]